MSIIANRTEVLSHSLDAVSLERVKEQIKVLEDDEDFLIKTYIQSAVSDLEKWAGFLLMPAILVSYYTEQNGRCRSGFTISARPFASINSVEVMQNGVYVELDSADYTVGQYTWETFVCIDSAITIDSVEDCGVDQIKISYKIGKERAVDVSDISTITVSGDSPQIATVTTTVPHKLTSLDQVSLSATGILTYDGIFTATVLNSIQFNIEYEGEPSAQAVTGLCAIPEIPPQLQLAVMLMVSKMYANRGDCSDECGNIPCISQTLAKTFRRYNLMSAGSSNACNC